MRNGLLPSAFHWLLAFILGGIVTFGTLTLWNGEFPIPVTTPTPTPTVTPISIPSGAWATATQTAMPVSVSQPGSTVKFGDSAQIQIALGDGQLSLISVSADAPLLASDADQTILLKSVPQLDGMSVYYLRVYISKVTGDPLAGADLTTLFEAVTQQRQPLQRLLLSDWRKCSGTMLPSDIDTIGTTATLCFAAAAPTEGLVPAGIQFSQSGGPYEAAQGTSIAWLP